MTILRFGVTTNFYSNKGWLIYREIYRRIQVNTKLRALSGNLVYRVTINFWSCSSFINTRYTLNVSLHLTRVYYLLSVSVRINGGESQSWFQVRHLVQHGVRAYPSFFIRYIHRCIHLYTVHTDKVTHACIYTCTQLCEHASRVFSPYTVWCTPSAQCTSLWRSTALLSVLSITCAVSRLNIQTAQQ